MNTETNPPEPYQGLRPYEEKDQDRFFGRDADCKILIDKILANKLTLLFAASGVGKSSLLQAAVLPKLKDPRQENLDAMYYNDWVTPPLTGLKTAVEDYLKHQGYIAVDTPIEQPDLKDFFGFCALFTRQPLILILDQFEEFFRYQRHQADYQPFIQQLAAAVTDRATPIAVVLSMREDFALELNEFKPHLPTLLFENFYRLERLSQDNARIALVTPLQQVGFRFEDALLNALLTDLSTRELGQATNMPVSELVDTVEPAYLQIICSQLWELDKTDTDKVLRYKTYVTRGKAKGLLESYVTSIVQPLTRQEQRLTSQAFNHLAAQRGVKMAYTAEALAKAIDAKQKTPLAEVLNKLEQGRILRSQKRQGEQWFEMYHDLFSTPIEKWNEAFKAKERNRRAIIATASAIMASLLVYGLYDGLSNHFNHHLRLSIKPEVSNALELYHGKAESLDLFKQRDYQAETDYVRSQIEPNKLFANKPVLDFDELNTELIGTLPLVERIAAYWEDGQQDKALTLANLSISNDDLQRSVAVINALSLFRSTKSIQVFAQQHNSVTKIKREIINALALGNFSNSEVLPILMSLIKDSDSFVRGTAAKKLGTFGKPEALLALIPLLSDTDSNVRLHAAEILGNLKQPEAVPTLIALLNEKGPFSFTRLHAAEVLAKLGHPKGLSELITLLKENDLYMSSMAAKTLESLGKPEAISMLVALLNDTDYGTRLKAARILGNMGKTEALPTLIDFLKDYKSENYSGYKYGEIEALGKLRRPESLPVLIHLLKDSDSKIRSMVAEILGNLGQPEAVLSLTPLLKDPDETVRGSVELALIALDKLNNFPVLIAMLKGKSPSKRLSAANILGSLGQSQAVSVLIDLLKETDRNVRSSAAFALGNLNQTEAVPTLITLLKDSDPYTRSRAADLLGRIGKPEALPPIIALFKENEYLVAKSAINALQVFSQPEAVSSLTTLFYNVYKTENGEVILRTLQKLYDPTISLQYLIEATEEGKAEKETPQETRSIESVLSQTKDNNINVQVKAITP